MHDISAEAINALLFDFLSSHEDFQISTMQDLDSKVVLVDDVYSPVSRLDMLAIARDNPLKVPAGTLKTELTDCDDYALQVKAMMMAKHRQNFITDTTTGKPPAVAIAISSNHAVNLFVEQDTDGNNSLCFIDASSPDVPMASDPEIAAQIMKEPPIRLIYM